MLENAWIIPAIPVASFLVILFFGKRFPQRGAEVGILALVACFALSLVTAAQWVARDETVPVVHHAEEAGHQEDDGHTEETDGGHAEEREEEHAIVDSRRDGAEHRVVLAAAEEEESDHDPTGDAGGGEHADEGEKKRAPVVRTVTWFQNGQVKIEAGTLIDGLAVALLLVVATISMLVHIFSAEYMRDDRRKTHYFAGLSLFTAGMFILVTSASTLQMMFGWELMGLCSFMLIGHWWEDKANSTAALKAFFTTRTGDVGLLVGVAMLFFLAGQTFNVMAINEQALAGQIDDGLLTVAAVALLCAVIGKSAQFPLHTWLPDAMAGPTPVSALIHAATMVVAGVFLIARMYGVFWEGFDLGASDGYSPVAMVGGVTVVIAALLAFVQSDIKKVLAYSTVSQLGYMVMALGVGAWTAGVFHLFTHAFFKACLFLGAGSVAHSGSHHSFDMKADMGGLRRHMPITFWTFTIASAALAGLPPLAGFWSKDEILVGADGNGYQAFLWVGVVGAFMTAAYMTRCIYLTFFGSPRGAAAHHRPHESPPLITGPLIFLAVLSVLAGFLNAVAIDIELFGDWFEPAFVSNVVTHHGFDGRLALLGTGAGLLGIASSYLFYWRSLGPHGLTERLRPARSGYTLLDNRYYLDHLYTGVVVGGLSGPVARLAYWINQNIIDGIVNGVGISMRHVGRFTYDVLDQRIVDGIANGTGYTAEESGSVLRTMQTGRVQQYAAVLFAAAALFAVALWMFT